MLEAGGEDLITSPEVFEIYTAAEDFVGVRDVLEQEFTLAQAELTMMPQTPVAFDDDYLSFFGWKWRIRQKINVYKEELSNHLNKSFLLD